MTRLAQDERRLPQRVHPTHIMTDGHVWVRGVAIKARYCRRCLQGRIRAAPLNPALAAPCVERVLQLARGASFSSGRDLRPEHCDLLETACLQNGDVPTLELVERARRAWPDAQDAVYAALTLGYPVYVNDSPRVTK